jgi:hypothetical protein
MNIRYKGQIENVDKAIEQAHESYHKTRNKVQVAAKSGCSGRVFRQVRRLYC